MQPLRDVLRFKLRRFEELVRGVEPTCLVQGLIPRVNATQELAVRCLAGLVKGAKAIELNTDWGLPAGHRGVRVDDWRKEFEARGDIDAKHERARKRWHELRNALKKRHAVVERDGFVWLP